jgi:hypothetical protein
MSTQRFPQTLALPKGETSKLPLNKDKNPNEAKLSTDSGDKKDSKKSNVSDNIDIVDDRHPGNIVNRANVDESMWKHHVDSKQESNQRS